MRPLAAPAAFQRSSSCILHRRRVEGRLGKQHVPCSTRSCGMALLQLELSDSLRTTGVGTTPTTLDAVVLPYPYLCMMAVQLHRRSVALSTTDWLREDQFWLHHRLFFDLLRCGGGPSYARGEAALEDHFVRAVSSFMEGTATRAGACSSTDMNRNTMLVEIYVASFLITSSTCSEDIAEKLRHVPPLQPRVLEALLALPVSTDVLRAIVQHHMSRRSAVKRQALSSAEFGAIMGGLLQNDAFFSAHSFHEMHSILQHSFLSACGDGIDYADVRWTPLMKKLARIYTKQGGGVELFDCFSTIKAAIPAAETKTPASFYVRLIGALVDASRADVWGTITKTAAEAIRLFGGDAKELRSIWVVLYKAARTLPPAEDEWRLLLQAYELCAREGHCVDVDHHAFLQLMRAISCAFHHKQQNIGTAQPIAEAFLQFVTTYTGLHVVWVMDGTAAILEHLWRTCGQEAFQLARQCVLALHDLLQQRGPAGIRVESSKSVRASMRAFNMGEPWLFLWQCGCGESIPGTCSCCLRCSELTKAAWLCPVCRATQELPCTTEACSRCGSMNPRHQSCTEHFLHLCSTCGAAWPIQQEQRGCPVCTPCEGPTHASHNCESCGTTYGADVLYCPKCFQVPPHTSLHLWMCVGCGERNVSSWISCHACGKRPPPKHEAVLLPFFPWRCGCATTNHPCSASCTSCSLGGTKRFCCPSCHQTSELSTSIIVSIRCSPNHIIHMLCCRHCSTIHPRDSSVPHSLSLPRLCAHCGNEIGRGDVLPNGDVYHCGHIQRLNPHVPFVCDKCVQGTVQTGFSCSSCGHPRSGATNGEEGSNYFIWRCMTEIGESASDCGVWNYSWSSRCTGCRHARRKTIYEMRSPARPLVQGAAVPAGGGGALCSICGAAHFGGGCGLA